MDLPKHPAVVFLNGDGTEQSGKRDDEISVSGICTGVEQFIPFTIGAETIMRYQEPIMKLIFLSVSQNGVVMKLFIFYLTVAIFAMGARAQIHVTIEYIAPRNIEDNLVFQVRHENIRNVDSLIRLGADVDNAIIKLRYEDKSIIEYLDSLRKEARRTNTRIFWANAAERAFASLEAQGKAEENAKKSPYGIGIGEAEYSQKNFDQDASANEREYNGQIKLIRKRTKYLINVLKHEREICKRSGSVTKPVVCNSGSANSQNASTLENDKEKMDKPQVLASRGVQIKIDPADTIMDIDGNIYHIVKIAARF